MAEGKPHPEIFLLAAEGLKMELDLCFVAEDAPAGIMAVRAGGMTALGVARCGDAPLLDAAGAGLVVTSLDDIAIDDSTSEKLRRRPS